MTRLGIYPVVHFHRAAQSQVRHACQTAHKCWLLSYTIRCTSDFSYLAPVEHQR